LGYQDFDKEAFLQRTAGLTPVRPLTEERRQEVWRHIIVESRTWANSSRVICSVLGELMVKHGDDPESRELLLTALDMGMRLAGALYKNKDLVAKLDAELKDLRHVVTIRWHMPGFLDYEPPAPATVHNWTEAEKLEPIANWLKQDAFFSVDRSQPDRPLMATMRDGRFYVVGYLDGTDFPRLPTWQKGRNEI
jgi:hypothetical protein